MNVVIDRSHLTDLLLVTLQRDPDNDTEERRWEVGDHEKPPKGGWQGTEGKSDWVPYFVLNALPSQTPSGDIATPGSDVWFGYAVTVVARTRSGAEKAMAIAHERLATLKRTKTPDGRTIGNIGVTRYGANERVALEPPLFLITNQFTVFTTK